MKQEKAGRLGDARDNVQAETETEGVEYTRQPIDDADSRGRGDMPADAVVVPKSGPHGGIAKHPEAPFGTVKHRKFVRGELVSEEDVTPPPAGTDFGAVCELDGIDEAKVRTALAEMLKWSHLTRDEEFRRSIDLEFGLSCVGLFVRYKQISREERDKLVALLNEMFGSRKVMGQLKLEVKE